LYVCTAGAYEFLSRSRWGDSVKSQRVRQDRLRRLQHRCFVVKKTLCLRGKKILCVVGKEILSY